MNQKSIALHRARGFTLIEVMIVVAIIAILATIAIPSYRNYILRGEIAQATSALSSYQAIMERHFQDNRTYGSGGSGSTAFASPCTTAKTFGNFSVSCPTAPSGTAFEVRAVGSGAASGYTFSINQDGTQATVAAPSGWASATTCATKWLIKKGMTC